MHNESVRHLYICTEPKQNRFGYILYYFLASLTYSLEVETNQILIIFVMPTERKCTHYFFYLFLGRHCKAVLETIEKHIHNYKRPTA